MQDYCMCLSAEIQGKICNRQFDKKKQEGDMTDKIIKNMTKTAFLPS